MMATKDLKGFSVLVVDDEPDVRLGITRLVESTGARVLPVGSAEEALLELSRREFDLVVSDVKMPGLSGVELLQRVKKERPGLDVVLITGYGTIALAVEALQAGAAHFLTKPFDNDELLTIVGRVGRRITAERKAAAAPGNFFSPIVTADPAMKAILELVHQAAGTRVPILITGESGTGKELIARAVHEAGPQREKSFLAVNCAALPDTLLESELFGYRKGAFTGANRDHPGLFAQAGGGSVFLDEIASMSLSFQGKLLRVLQEKIVRPLGATKDESVDFRLICASNRPLRPLVEKGGFREDLFYRLCVVVIDLPPLRDRRADIPPLAAHFLGKAARECLGSEAPPPEISEEALAELAAHSWPGNVRELENAIQRAVIVCRGSRILPAHLLLEAGPRSVGTEPSGALGYEAAKSQVVERFQRQFITRALERTHGNISRAAAECGLTRNAIQKIMKSLGLEREGFV